MQIRYNRNEPVMKTKKVRIERSKTGKALYWLQFILTAPILIAFLLLWGLGEAVCNSWTSYRRWFLSKFNAKIVK